MSPILLIHKPLDMPRFAGRPGEWWPALVVPAWYTARGKTPREFVEALERGGWTIRCAEGNHWRLTPSQRARVKAARGWWLIEALNVNHARQALVAFWAKGEPPLPFTAIGGRVIGWSQRA